jgi:hypothetical protein
MRLFILLFLLAAPALFTARAADGRDIVSKTYQLKSADPYEIKPFLESAVKAGSPRAAVECMKLNDGSGMVIVSAEAYRFGTQSDGSLSIDQLVEKLDRPGAKVQKPEPVVYFAESGDARNIAKTLRNAGFIEDAKVTVDTGLNAVVVYPSSSNSGKFGSAAAVVKAPRRVCMIYNIYELFCEKPKDFEPLYKAWKEGPGSRFFCEGLPKSEYDGSRHVPPNLDFDPRFFDFLVLDKKAVIRDCGNVILSDGRETSVIKLPAGKEGISLSAKALILEKSVTVDLQLGNTFKRIVPDEKGNTGATVYSGLNAAFKTFVDGPWFVVGGVGSDAMVPRPPFVIDLFTLEVCSVELPDKPGKTTLVMTVRIVGAGMD